MEYKCLINHEWNVLKRKTIKIAKNHRFFVIFAMVTFTYACLTYRTTMANHWIWQSYPQLVYIFIVLGIMLYGFIGRKTRLTIHHAHLLLLDEGQIGALVRMHLMIKWMVYLTIIIITHLFFIELGIIKVLLLLLVCVWQDMMGMAIYHSHYKSTWEMLRVLNGFAVCLIYFEGIGYMVFILMILVQCVLLGNRLRSNKWNRNLYYETMKRYDRIQYAARTNDFYEMQVINNENRAYKGRRFSFYKTLDADHALFQKIILTLRRTDLRTLVLLGLISYVGLILNRLIWGNNYLNILIIMIYLINMNSMFTLQLKRLLHINREGLFLDYSYTYIVGQYSIVHFILATLFLMGCTVILSPHIMTFIMIDVLYLPVIFLRMYIAGKRI